MNPDHKHEDGEHEHDHGGLGHSHAPKTSAWLSLSGRRSGLIGLLGYVHKKVSEGGSTLVKSQLLTRSSCPFQPDFTKGERTP